ncbi:hypothetical protein KC19_VG189500 [Ceratodon purpureus]|uniref:Uncharacterized protein n=1 Tax=Ceratodon purpureus TaxID=3225 RepID=A0A8T0HS25_CERPU|nr:hypothetical protein KC19_VG189500 [Ceratodon purpureus]
MDSRRSEIDLGVNDAIDYGNVDARKSKLGGTLSVSILDNDRLDPLSYTIMRELDERFSSLQEDKYKKSRNKKERKKTSRKGEDPLLKRTASLKKPEESKVQEPPIDESREAQQRQKWAEHLEDADYPGPKLSWTEFFSQRPVQVDEFGPGVTLDSIYMDYLDMPFHPIECKKEWRLQTYRFLEVEKMKRQGEETAIENRKKKEESNGNAEDGVTRKCDAKADEGRSVDA